MAQAVIQVAQLKIGYGERCVLKDAGFSIGAGEIVGIIGCNGAGKSTLLKTIRGLLPKQGGSVSYFGKPLEAYADKELATKIAYLQQHVEVGFGYTGKDIVMAGRYPYMKWWERESEEDERLALACMEYTGTADLAERPVTEVSGGQKQRILIAKVLAQQTPIIFLDEPTTGLHASDVQKVMELLDGLVASGNTVIVIEHNLDVMKQADWLIDVGPDGGTAGGEIVFTGTPNEMAERVHTITADYLRKSL